MGKKAEIRKNIVEQKVLEGIKEIAGIVQVTLGPAGRPVIMQQGDNKALITKDGVTVAKNFESPDPIKNLIATAAREACERTVRQAGDGTTTAIVLASALVEAGQRFLKDNPSYSPQRLARELKGMFESEIKPTILELARPIRGLEPEEARKAIRHVALVSANHDVEIANAVAEATEYVGENGMVVAEEGLGTETKVVHQSGFPITSGLADLGGAASAAFVNRTSHGDCLIETAYVLMYDGDINDIQQLIPFLEQVQSEMTSTGHRVNAPVLVVAHSFSNIVLKLLAENFRKNTVRTVPLITPRNGQAMGKQAFLHDLAAYVGGEVFEPQARTLDQANLANTGFAERIRVSRGETVIFTEPDVELVEKRIADLKEQMSGASEFDQDKIRYRIGQLTGGVATVYAGGATAVEAKERHARVVDAVSAVRSALELGVIPGGGSTLAFIGSRSEPKGARLILNRALTRPFLQILENGGFVDDTQGQEEFLSKIGPAPDSFFVFDALEGRFCEWYQHGIMDPAKVTLTALENALSVAQLLMTLGGVIVEERTADADSIRAMQEGILRAVNGDNVE
jgi:chaperonin GroEL